MGQNRQAKRTNQMMDDNYSRTSREYEDFYNTRDQYSNEARGRSDDAYQRALSGYQSIADNPGFGGGGGNRASRYYEDFANNGGLDDENIRRIRGNGVFGEFSKTGGLSESDIANMRLHGSAVVPGFFDALKSNLTRSTNVSGYNPGYNAQTRNLARDSARGAQEAALNTELGIVDTRNRGRQWGTEGLSSAELGLVGAQQRGKMFGIEGMDSVSRDNSANQRAAMEARLAAIGGIRGLRTDTPGEVGMYEDEVAGSLGGGASARRGLLQDRASYNPNQSWFDKYGMPLINAAGGVASGFASGGIRPRAPRRPSAPSPWSMGA